MFEYTKIHFDKYIRDNFDINNEIVLRKVKHSYDTVNMAEYIADDLDLSTEDRELAKVIALLHDIGRFREISELYRQNHGHFIGSKLDHGLFGAQYLEQTPSYNSPFIVIPVKYHNKLIEDYYNSDDYQQLGKNRDSITEVLKLVRDADKIANFHLITTQTQHLKKLFCPEAIEGKALAIQPAILSDFMAEKTIDLKKVQTACDRILNLLSWVYDLNYLSSFEFCIKLNCFDKMLNILQEYNPDAKVQKEVENKLKSYINKQYKLLSSN